MARSRNIKPGFFKNEVLGELPFHVRLLFVGLWTHADREGRCEFRPRRIKADLFPYDDNFDVADGVAELAEAGFLTVYDMDGQTYIQIRNWTKHQAPHHKEVGSVIPGPPGHVDRVCPGYIPLSNTIRRRIYERDGRKCRECGAEHGLSIDHIIPITKGGNSTDDNLQVLCLGCNARKGNRILQEVYVSPMHDASMEQASSNESAPCPTDSLIPDSLIPDSKVTASDARPLVTDVVLGAYHLALPRCQQIHVLNDKRKKRIAAAVKLARQVCACQGWHYDPAEFWGAYFAECAKDPWMRGDVPHPTRPGWKQNIDVLLAEDRFAGIMDRAIAAMREAA